MSACEVAVTFTVGGFGTVEGAVYKPAEVTVPHAEPVQPVPLTVQATAVLVLPLIVAWNCRCAPTVTSAVAGEMATDIGTAIFTLAGADLLVSACDVAVTVTEGGFGTIAGAVYNPADEIFPQALPVQPEPEMLHETSVLEVPLTSALNCLEPEGAIVAEVGEIVMVTTGTTVTEAVADLLGSATEAAVTEKNGGAGSTAGAVYSPAEVTVPQVVPAQPDPVIVQVTAVLDEPVTVTVNCWCPPVPIWTEVGEIEIPTAVPVVMVTVADPDFVGSDSNVAVTATMGGFGAWAGAVYNPLLPMLPQADPLHPLPEILHTKRADEFPLDEAVNCNWAPGFTCADDGETLTEEPATRVTVAVAEADGSLTAVAFTVTLAGLGRLAGAA